MKKIKRIDYDGAIPVSTLKKMGVVEEIGEQKTIARWSPDAEDARISGLPAFTTPIYTKSAKAVKVTKTVRTKTGRFKKGKIYPVSRHWIDKALGIGYWAVYPDYD